MAKLLVESKRSSLNKADKDGQTPFSYAASSIYEGVVQILLRREEINANQPETHSRGLFLLAVPRKPERVGQLLLGRGRGRLAKIKNNSIFYLGYSLPKKKNSTQSSRSVSGLVPYLSKGRSRESRGSHEPEGNNRIVGRVSEL